VSDTRLRALERAAQDDPSRSAELLVARMRRGNLTLDRVELAAWCGDPAARAAVSDCDGVWHVSWEAGTWWGRESSPDTWLDLEPWLRGLARWGADVLVRAAVAAARVAWVHYVEGVGAGSTHYEGCSCCTPPIAIDAAEAWLACPCARHASEAERLGPGRVGPRRRWCTSVGQAIAAIDQSRRSPRLEALSEVAADYAREAIEGSAAIAGEARVLDAIRSSLTAWALSSERTS
jgi:hypothetical protein